MYTSALNHSFYMHPYAFAGCVNFDPTVMSKTAFANHIIITVCHELGLKVEALSERTRKRDICFARQVSMFLIKHHTKMTLKEIGKQFGDLQFDHTLVIHSIQTINNWMDTDPDVKQLIERLLSKTKFPKRFTDNN